MINRSTYLLVLLIEECAEVIQRACKCIRFGLDEIQRAKDHLGTKEVAMNPILAEAEPNDVRLKGELTDLFTVVHLLKRHKVLEEEPKVSVDKILKIEKYHRYSVFMGLAEGPGLDKPMI